MHKKKKDDWKSFIAWWATSVIGFCVSHHAYMHAENIFTCPIHVSIVHLTKIHY